MKTKNRYTPSILALFIGLVSLYTLSACVHLGKALSVIDYNNRPESITISEEQKQLPEQNNGVELNEEEVTEDFVQVVTHLGLDESVSLHKSNKPIVTILTSISFMLPLTLGGIYYLYYYMLPAPPPLMTINDLSIDNATTTFPMLDQVGVVPIRNRPGPSIENGITTVATAGVETLGVAGKELLDSNSSEGFKQIKNPILLDKEIIDYLRLHDFSKESIAYYLKRGLSINAKDVVGTPLLSYFITYNKNNQDYLQFAIDQKADLNGQDSYGNTILHQQVLSGHEDNILLLLNNGANPIIENNKGHTPLFYAQKSHNQFIIETVEKAAKNWPLEHRNHKREVRNLFITPKLNEIEKTLMEAQKKWNRPDADNKKLKQPKQLIS